MTTSPIAFTNLRGLQPITDVRQIDALLGGSTQRQAQIVACVGRTPAWHLTNPADLHLLSAYGLAPGAGRLAALRITDGAADDRLTPPCGLPGDTLPKLANADTPGALYIRELSMPQLLECITPLLARYAPGAMRSFNNLPDHFEDADAGLAVLSEDLRKWFGLRVSETALKNRFYAEAVRHLHGNIFFDHYFEGSTKPEACLRTVLATLCSTPVQKAEFVTAPPLRPSFRFTAGNESVGDLVTSKRPGRREETWFNQKFSEGLDENGFHNSWFVMCDRPGLPSYVAQTYDFDDNQECVDQMMNAIQATERLNAAALADTDLQNEAVAPSSV